MLKKKNFSDERINTAELAKYAAKAKKGDDKAVEKLIELTSDYVYYYCLTLLCDEERAVEAVQDIYLILIQKIQTLKDSNSCLGWLKVITSNYCKNRLTRECDEVSLENIDYDLSDEEIQVNPGNAVEAEELCQAVALAVKTLPDSQREIILMRYYQEMSVKQISEVLDIKEGTVKSRLYNSRKAIKNELTKLGIDAEYLGVISPLAYITESLLRDKANTDTLLSSFVIPKSMSFQGLSSAYSGTSLTTAATGFSATAKAALPFKAIAVTTACVIAAGGIATTTVRNLNSENSTTDSAYIISDLSNTPQNVTKQNGLKIFMDNMGYTEKDLRKELTFDNRLEYIGCDENKEYIYDRMCNSIDYFTTAYGWTTYEFEGTKYILCYFVDQKTNKSKEVIFDYSDFVYLSEPTKIRPKFYTCREGDKEVTLIFDDKLQEKYSFDWNPPFKSYEESAMYKVFNLSKDLRAADIKNISENNIGINYHYDDDKTDYLKEIDSRKRISFRKSELDYMQSTAVLFPQYLAKKYLSDFDKWKIAKNKDSDIAGSVLIEGKYQNSDFTMIVDKQTGFIVNIIEESPEKNVYMENIASNTYYDQGFDEDVFDDLSTI